MPRRIAPPAPPYLGPAKFHGGSQSLAPLKWITIHGTVSPCKPGGARDIARYFKTTVTRPSSAHYVIDPSEVVQVVGDHQVAFHAPPNGNTIGIEHCDPVAGDPKRWNDKAHTLMLARSAVVVARLCLAYDVPIRHVGTVGLKLGRRGITGHLAVGRAFRQTSHTDPGTGFPWRRYIALVQHAAKELLDAPTDPPVPPITPLPPTPALPLKVVTANLWRENKHAKGDALLLGKTRAHLIGINEGRNWLKELDAVPGYRLVKDGTGAHLNNPVLVRDDVPVVASFSRLMCAAVGTSPARTAEVVRYRLHGELRAHVQTHANAHIEKNGKPRALPRVKANVQHMRRLAALVRSLQKEGHRVTVAGDFNWAHRAGALWFYSPRAVFKRLGMSTQWSSKGAPAGGSLGKRRIDYIAHEPRDLTVTGQRMVPGEHSDHRWPEVTYRVT